MSIPFKKYGYELNPITDEYKTPKIYLADKQIHRIGQLYPVENLKITINEINQADEVSFTYHRSVNGEDAPLFDKLDDLSIILVEGYGYFEIAIDKNEHSTVTKSVTGISLGHAELSQILTTLEINTDDDMARPDYDDDYPTVLYRKLDEIYDEEIMKKCRESSLLHRILSCAPHYRIGSVSPSLCPIQRTFSWSDTDILSILNDISKEINCAFDIQIYNEDGKPQRVLNVYDMQYCDNCFNQRDVSGNPSSNTYRYRTIIDGVCQNCNSSAHVKDIGDVTNIFISTENLSDDISIRGDKDSIKNCFKVVGGDDIITNTLNGLNMSASNRIMMFSDTQKREMSPELSAALDSYDENYKDKLPEYEKLLETEYNIFDIKHYLRSAKMPSLEKENLTTDAALAVVIQKITEYYDKKFYISSYENYGYVSARTSIQNTFTTFMPEGYSFTMDYDSMTEKTKDYDSATAYQWYGTIRIYSTGNRDDSYTIHLQPSEDTYVTCGTNTEKYTFTDPDVQGIINSFSILFVFADQSQTEYIDYIEQHTKYILSTVDLSYENEKKRPWNLYSYNRLKSFYDGYQTCIETLDEMDRSETTGSETDLLLKKMIASYQAIQKDILSQMNVLLDQIFAICSYHGEYDADFIDAGGKVNYTLQYYNDIPSIYDRITDPAYTGGYQNEAYKVNEFIGTKPFQCKKCGSSNVAESTNGNLCRNSHCNGSGTDIYTYLDIMKNICDSYKENPGETITGMRNACQSQFDMSNYLTDEQYAELRSFIREDVYTNSNYTSDGLNNSQIIEHAKELMAKARQELAKACNTQYTINTSLASVVAQKPFLYHGVTVNDDYAGFKINNFVWVRIDGKIYKMRIASMEFTFPVSDRIEVTFTNVTDYKSSTSDIKEILDKAGSMATSYRYVATQAEKGAVANAQFDTIKREGLDAGLMAVKAGRDQDIVIDNHGILLRKKIEETDDYSQYQMKLINRNIVMTDDNWEHARMAIGLGSYTINGEKKLVYGIWADLLCGDLTITKELHVQNDSNSVIIDENGITLDGGAITWKEKLPMKDVEGLDTALDTIDTGLKEFENAIPVTTIGEDYVISPKIGGGYLYITGGAYSVEIDPNHKAGTKTKDRHLFCIRNKTTDDVIMGVDTSGNGFFNGKIEANSGTFGKACIRDDVTIYIPDFSSISSFTPKSTDVSTVLTDCVIIGDDYGMYTPENLNPYEETDPEPYVRGNILDLEHGFLQIGDTRVFDNGIAYSQICTNTTHSNNDIEEYWQLDKNGFTSYEVGIRSSRGNSTYYHNNSSIHFICGTYSDMDVSESAKQNYAKLSSKIRYQTDGFHEFIGNYINTPDIRCRGVIYNTGSSAVTSDQNKKHAIEDPDDRYLSLFDELEIKRFKYNDGTSGRYHLGAIAQSVERSMEKAGLTSEEFAGLVNDGGDYYLRYDELNMLTALKVKEMERHYNKIIESLYDEISQLK